MSEEKHNVRVTISSLGNERRVVNFGECDDEQIDKIVQTVQVAFNVIRSSDALTLAGTDGVSVFANLNNVDFVEVQVG